MDNSVRWLTWICGVVLVVVTGCSDDASEPAAIEAGVATGTPAGVARLAGVSDYAGLICSRASEAEASSMIAFFAAAEAYDAADGDGRSEAASVEGWALGSGRIWLDMADWSATIIPPDTLLGYHTELERIFEDMAVERGQLLQEVQEATGFEGVWGMVQRVWTMTLLEPLPFIAVEGLLSDSDQASFRAQGDCGPLFVTGPVSPATSRSDLHRYSTQVCWLFALGWEQQQQGFQELASQVGAARDLESYRDVAFTFTRQEQRTQLLLGLGLRAIEAPTDLAEFHDALLFNTVSRLQALLFAEEAALAATSEDEARESTNGLLFKFSTLADEVIALRDGASAEVRMALEGHGQCGALDGSELAFYESLTG
jgi:hypothetical protein